MIVGGVPLSTGEGGATEREGKKKWARARGKRKAGTCLINFDLISRDLPSIVHHYPTFTFAALAALPSIPNPATDGPRDFYIFVFVKYSHILLFNSAYFNLLNS